jgi:hypothetical protein
MAVNLAAFDKHLAGSNALAVLLRGHLYTETMLNRLLGVNTVQASAINVDRMNYRAKVDIAEAFGFLPASEAAPLRALNTMRNRMAHNLDGEPQPHDIRALLGSLTGRTRAAYEAVVALGPPYDGSRNPDGPELDLLRAWFFSIVGLLDFLSELQLYERVYRTEIMSFHAVKIRQPTWTDEQARKQVNLPEPPDLRQSWQQ